MATTIPPVNEEMKKFIHSLLTHMVQNKGSDMFITAGFPPAMKLDGKLTRLTDKPLSAEHTMQIALLWTTNKLKNFWKPTNVISLLVWLVYHVFV